MAKVIVVAVTVFRVRDSEVETKASVETEAVAEAGTDQEAEGKIEDADIKEEQAEILDKEAVKENADENPENPGNPGIK